MIKFSVFTPNSPNFHYYQVKLNKKDVKALRVMADILGYNIVEVGKESGCWLTVDSQHWWGINTQWKIHDVINEYMTIIKNKNVNDIRCEGAGGSNGSVSE